MISEFMMITRHFNWVDWVDWDELNGKKIKDGEILEVKFKNKSIATIKAKVETSSYEISDMGTPYTISVSHAFYMHNVNGDDVKIPLRGLMARRLK